MKAGGIRIVLVSPSHPGNIGATARAMKNMALSELVLVNPRQFPHPEALARASGAADVLAAARVVPSLAAALADCGYVAATTSRDRDQYFRVIDVREAAARLVAESNTAAAAVVFGPESRGLPARWRAAQPPDRLLRIPIRPEARSLNLANAASIAVYEALRQIGREGTGILALDQ